VTKAVIFDWDGTLADTKKPVVQSFQTVLKKSGCLVGNDTIEKRIGIGTKNTLEKILEECNMQFDQVLLEKLAEEKIKTQLRLIKAVHLFDGAIELLEELQGKIKIALATMSPRKVIDAILSEKKIKKYFNVVFSADEVISPKPNPEIFLISAKSLGIESKDCIVVEDSVFGIKAAKEAKMKCIAVSSGAYSREELQKEQPNIVVASLMEKEKILKFIFG
jgi:beta-phosphoglucomutase